MWISAEIWLWLIDFIFLDDTHYTTSHLHLVHVFNTGRSGFMSFSTILMWTSVEIRTYFSNAGIIGNEKIET